MLSALMTLVCAQTVFPTARTAIEVGNSQRQPYAASEGAISWKSDGGLGVVWLDARRSLGGAGLNRADLWSGNLVVGALEPAERTGLLLVDAPVVGSLESPGVAFNGGVRAVVWLERAPNETTVKRHLGPEAAQGPLSGIEGLATSTGISGVAVSAVGSDFIVAWTDGVDFVWQRFTPTGVFLRSGRAVGSLPKARPRIAPLADGGAFFGYETETQAGAFDWDFTTTSDAGALFETSGSLAGVAFPPWGGSLFFDNTANLRSRSVATPSPLLTISGTAGLRSVVAGNELHTALAFRDAANASKLGFLVGAAVVTISAPPAEPVETAVSATLAAFLRRTSGLSVVTLAPADVASPAIELNEAQPTQRGPSVAWLPDAGGFLLAFEERNATRGPTVLTEGWTSRLALIAPDGGVFTAPQVSTGAFPRVVEWSDDSFGLEDQGLFNRSHRVVTAQGSVGPRSPSSGLRWQSAAGPPLLMWRSTGTTATELTPPFPPTLPITSPRCAAAVSGVHSLAGWNGSNLVLYQLSSGSGQGMTPLSSAASPLDRGSVCVTRGRAPNELLAAWSEGRSIRVQPIGAPGATGFTLTPPARVLLSENPVATRLGSGVLVVWETPPSYAELGAAFIDDSSPALPKFLTLGTGTDLVRNPAVTSANGSVAVVAWQEFDQRSGVGATRIRARLVFPPAPDGGVDAGTPDAGMPDAGSPDGGDPDAGVLDGSVPDAGERDGGTNSGDDAGVTGVPMTLEFVPTCGCSVSPSAGLLVVLGVLAARRRVRQPVRHFGTSATRRR